MLIFIWTKHMSVIKDQLICIVDKDFELIALSKLHFTVLAN